MSKYSEELKAQVIKEAKDTGNAKSRKLQKELEDARLENEILKELLKKTNQAWLKE